MSATWKPRSWDTFLRLTQREGKVACSLHLAFKVWDCRAAQWYMWIFLGVEGCRLFCWIADRFNPCTGWYIERVEVWKDETWCQCFPMTFLCSWFVFSLRSAVVNPQQVGWQGNCKSLIPKTVMYPHFQVVVSGDFCALCTRLGKVMDWWTQKTKRDKWLQRKTIFVQSRLYSANLHLHIRWTLGSSGNGWLFCCFQGGPKVQFAICTLMVKWLNLQV